MNPGSVLVATITLEKFPSGYFATFSIFYYYYLAVFSLVSFVRFDIRWRVSIKPSKVSNS